MNIAILDDLYTEAESLKHLIQECGEDNNIICQINIYTSPDKFYTDFTKNNFSALFIDILMPETNGMELARKIRKINYFVPIIFVTTEKSYALEGYEVQAFDYLIKPPQKERISNILNRISSSNRECIITIKKNRQTLHIPENSILYAEARGHNVDIHTTANTHTVYMSFKGFTELLPNKKKFFIYNRGAVVNFENVSKISKDFFIMVNDEHLHISRSKIAEMKIKYAEYAFEKTRGN